MQVAHGLHLGNHGPGLCQSLPSFISGFTFSFSWAARGTEILLWLNYFLMIRKVKSESESEAAQSCLTLCDPWTVAHQAPPSMGFSRQEYWSGLPLPSPAGMAQNLVFAHVFLSVCIFSLGSLIYSNFVFCSTYIEPDYISNFHFSGRTSNSAYLKLNS